MLRVNKNQEFEETLREWVNQGMESFMGEAVLRARQQRCTTCQWTLPGVSPAWSQRGTSGWQAGGCRGSHAVPRASSLVRVFCMKLRRSRALGEVNLEFLVYVMYVG